MIKSKRDTLIPNEIIVSSLNVYGLQSKIKFGNLDDYVDKVDIFCVSESKSKTGINIDNFTIFNLENKKNSHYLAFMGYRCMLRTI